MSLYRPPASSKNSFGRQFSCNISIAIISGAGIFAAATPAQAQDVSPVEGDRARREAERAAAERAARQGADVVSLPQGDVPALGPIPEGEAPCFKVERILVEGADRRRLRWVPDYLARYRGRCLGPKGLDHVLRSLQAAFLDRGLITTRALLPEQELASGSLVVRIVPGMVSAVRTNGEDEDFGWSVASPVDAGDIVSLRALEQGIEQMRRLPGREVAAELVPGDEPGDSIIAVTDKGAHPIAFSFDLDNFAGQAVGRWQGSAQLAALNLLGAREIVSLSYNRRIDAPGLPADSRGLGASLSFPLGWWIFGASASSNRYSQRIEGETARFDTLGRQRSVSAYVNRTLARGQASKTDLKASLTRRWGRNYIEDVEIGIQRQDVTDVTLALVDRRQLGIGRRPVRLDSEIAWRMGTGLFGAQDESDRPDALPTSRYRIFTADIAAEVPLAHPLVKRWRLAFRGQVSRDRLYGSDSFSVGGPYTVRGFESDRAGIGRSGWYLRQELAGKPVLSFAEGAGDHLEPFLLLDVGRVKDGADLLAGLGAGLRAQWRGLRLEGFGAVPLSGIGGAVSRTAVVGLAIGWSV